MVARVQIGLRAGQYGLWVSKPGNDVLTAADDAMLLSTARRSAQVVASGSLAVAQASSYGISWPYSLGFNPVILATCPRMGVAYAHTSSTTATLITGPNEDFARWTTVNRPKNAPFVVYWAVLNVPHP